jgi:hypothetical protein
MEQQDVCLERPELQGSLLQDDNEETTMATPRNEGRVHAFPEADPAVLNKELETLKVEKTLMEKNFRNMLNQNIMLQKENSDLKERVKVTEESIARRKGKQGEIDELKSHLGRTAVDRTHVSRKVDDAPRKPAAFEELKAQLSHLQATLSESDGRLRQAKLKERRAYDHAGTCYALNEEITSDTFLKVLDSHIDSMARKADDIGRQEYDQMELWLNLLTRQNEELQRDLQRLQQERQHSSAAPAKTSISNSRPSTATTGPRHISSLGALVSSSNFAMTPWGNNFSRPGTRPQSAYASERDQPTSGSRDSILHKKERATFYGLLPHNVKKEPPGTELPTPTMSRRVMNPHEFAYEAKKSSKKAVRWASGGGVEVIGAQAEQIVNRPALRSRRATIAQPLTIIIEQPESPSPAININSPQAGIDKIRSSIRSIDSLLSRSQGISQVVSPKINAPTAISSGEASSTPEILHATVYQPKWSSTDQFTQTEHETVDLYPARTQAQTTTILGAPSANLVTVQAHPVVESMTGNRQNYRQENSLRPVELPGGAELGTLSSPSIKGRINFFDPGRAQQPDARNRLAIDTSRRYLFSVANPPLQRTSTPGGLPAPHTSSTFTVVQTLPTKTFTDTGVGASPIAQNVHAQTVSTQEPIDLKAIPSSLTAVEISEKIVDMSPDLSAVTVSDYVKPSRPSLGYYVEPWGPSTALITAEPSPGYYVTPWGPPDTPEIAPETPEDFAQAVLPPPEDMEAEEDGLISVSDADLAVSETSDVNTSRDQVKVFDVQESKTGDVVREDDSTLLTVPDTGSDLQGRRQSKLAIDAGVPAVSTSPVSPEHVWAASNGVTEHVEPPSPERPLRRQHTIKGTELEAEAPHEIIVPAGFNDDPEASRPQTFGPLVVVTSSLRDGIGQVPLEIADAGMIVKPTRVRKIDPQYSLDSPPPPETYIDSDQKVLKKSFHRNYTMGKLGGNLARNKLPGVSPPVLPPAEKHSTSKIADQEDAAALVAVPDELDITTTPSNSTREAKRNAVVMGISQDSRRSSHVTLLQHESHASGAVQEDDIGVQEDDVEVQENDIDVEVDAGSLGIITQEDDHEVEVAIGSTDTIIAPPLGRQSVTHREKPQSTTIEDDAQKSPSKVIAPDDAQKSTSRVIAHNEDAPKSTQPADTPMTPAGLAPELYSPPKSARRALTEPEKPDRNAWLEEWCNYDMIDRGNDAWQEEMENLDMIDRGTDADSNPSHEAGIRRAEQVINEINARVRGFHPWLRGRVLAASGYPRRLAERTTSLTILWQMLVRSMGLFLIGLIGVILVLIIQLRDAVDMWQSVNVNPNVRYHVLAAREGYWGNSWVSLLDWGIGVGSIPALLV